LIDNPKWIHLHIGWTAQTTLGPPKTERSIFRTLRDRYFETLVLEHRIFGVLPASSAAQELCVGDHICFYAKQIRVVGHAQVASAPTENRDERIPQGERYSITFELMDPIALDEPVDLRIPTNRAKLNALRSPAKSWSWFVRNPHVISAEDFELLTRS
jgi:hypothetical protein